MKRALSTIVLIVIGVSLYAQSDTTQLGSFEVRVNDQWTVQENSTPPISLTKKGFFDDIVISNISYPTLARRMGIEGNTLVEIQIDNSGNSIGQSVVHHIGADTDEELEQLLSELPTTWIPATFNDQNVDSRILIIFKFTLNKINTVENMDGVYKYFIVRPLSTTATSTINANDLGKPNVKNRKKSKSKK